MNDSVCSCALSSYAAQSSSVDQGRVLSSSTFGPRVRVCMCRLEGLVAAGDGGREYRGELGMVRREQALRAGQFFHLLSV